MTTSPRQSVVGLRIDVDTFDGTRFGMPRLLALLREYGVQASVFFSLGPDNMGRHLWRLRKWDFARKMIRSNAPNLYGWRIITRGTLWPGPQIGDRLKTIIQAAAGAGHEVGLHAWDHHWWQLNARDASNAAIEAQLRRGSDTLSTIMGAPVACAAMPGWVCNEAVLTCLETFPFDFGSDCRGTSVFRPLVWGRILRPQVPTTLPTYDECIGERGVTDGNYNEYLLSRIAVGQLNTLTVHAEVEGQSKHALFRAFLEQALGQGLQFCPLGALVTRNEQIPVHRVAQLSVDGREGKVCYQGSLVG